LTLAPPGKRGLVPRSLGFRIALSLLFHQCFPKGIMGYAGRTATDPDFTQP
jgi:hypothetical protein